MAKIQGPKEEKKTYYDIYKEEWTQPWPIGSEIYLEVHENPRAFFSSSSPILLEPLAHGSSEWPLPREDCINNNIGIILWSSDNFYPFKHVINNNQDVLIPIRGW